MKLFYQVKKAMMVLLSALAFISCSKDSYDDGGGGTPELPGYWKGNTTPPGNFTNPLNGLNFSIKTGNQIRVYYSAAQRPLNDTTAADVVKQDGTYTVSNDDITITTPKIVCTGTKNAAFTSMQGTFQYNDFGLILTQSFVVKK